MPETEKNDNPGSSGTRPQLASGFKRRWLLNAGLLGLIAALVWIVAQRSGQQQDVPGPPLTGLSAAAVSHARIERPGSQPSRSRKPAMNGSSPRRCRRAPTV